MKRILVAISLLILAIAGAFGFLYCTTLWCPSALLSVDDLYRTSAISEGVSFLIILAGGALSFVITLTSTILAIKLFARAIRRQDETESQKLHVGRLVGFSLLLLFGLVCGLISLELLGITHFDNERSLWEGAVSAVMCLFLIYAACVTIKEKRHDDSLAEGEPEDDSDESPPPDRSPRRRKIVITLLILLGVALVILAVSLIFSQSNNAPKPAEEEKPVAYIIQVLDQSDQPVVGATVSINDRQLPGYAKLDGRVSFSAFRRDQVTFRRHGFKSLTQNMSGDPREKYVYLDPKTGLISVWTELPIQYTFSWEVGGKTLTKTDWISEGDSLEVPLNTTITGVIKHQSANAYSSHFFRLNQDTSAINISVRLADRKAKTPKMVVDWVPNPGQD
jgi:hypothetical protein